ncbi:MULTISPECIES: type VII secretion integral membrane protein EccD [Streptomyces]|uniref:type VII secretion integral membrane protein EccD n=1 Tax=Streptomyces TaxID=1883 RepID=UPI00240D54E0|nr:MULTISPECIES: type VII secretion integral membrane protein EccD [Streptomyces]WFB88508.1 type VII secretion integral membrane protein EccD [Streptomyces olivaceus]WGK50950.1 type VII secretion integral membrane protein EccD [Streptomyces sp. B146]
MTQTPVGELCRLTVRAPEKVVDLAVPADVALADLLPVIVSHAGEDLEEAGVEHDGWVLQRMGGEPLDLEFTPASLNLLEGETLLLRPAGEALPSVRYDNIVDALSEVVGGLPHAWSPAFGRWVLRLSCTAAMVASIVLTALPGAPSSRAALLAGAALLSLALGSTAVRFVEDRVGGVVLGVLAALALALLGAVLTSGPAYDEAGLGHTLLAAGSTGAVGALIAYAAISSHPVVFAAVGLVHMSVVCAAAFMLLLDTTLFRASAAVCVLVVAFGAYVPVLSFSLAGLRLPPLPTNARQLNEGTEPHTSESVAERGRATEQWITGFLLATGVVCAGCLAMLTADGGTPATVTSLLLILLLFLHSRNLGAAWQRLALVIPAVTGLLLLIPVHAIRSGRDAVLPGALGLLVLAVCFCVLAWSLPGRRVIPHWGRAGDLLQSATAIALLPSACWVLGVYGRLRAMNG